MFHMGIDKICAVTGATAIVGGSREVAGPVAIDSRKVEPGGLFVAFAGEKVDGNKYLVNAIEAGAAAVVATAEPAPEAVDAARAAGCALLHAASDDGEEFMLRLASAWREEHPGWLVLAVTGSVGKTTTKDMLAAACASQRRTHATAGNFNNLIGLPLTLFAAPEDAEVVVCELGMNHPREIERMAAACRPALACITNVGTSHIGYLGSREGIARAKAEVVSGLRAHNGVGPALALGSSGDFTSFIANEFAAPAGVDALLAGTHDTDDVRVSEVTLDEEGHPSATLTCSDGWTRRATLRLVGAKTVDDLALALALAWRAGLDRDAAVEAIERLEAAHMRLDVRQTPSGARVIDDSYNAAPNSMASGLDLLARMSCEGRRIAVLGEMGELGDDAPRLHALVGAYAAAKSPDLLAFIGGDLADIMAEAARTMGFSDDSLERFEDAASAADVLGPVLGAGDLVLVKASRSVGLDEFVRRVTA